MIVSYSKVEKLVIETEKLDPISVYMEDIKDGVGKLTVTCYGKSWTGFWASMGKGVTLKEFILSASNDYIQNKISTTKSTIDDWNAFGDKGRCKILERRRDLDISGHRARELYNCMHELDGLEEVTASYHTDLLHDVFGPEWWYDVI
jgi:hypothetical protein